jgi:DNA ligase (NAD+)
MAQQENRSLFRHTALVVRVLSIGLVVAGELTLRLPAEVSPSTGSVQQLGVTEAAERIDALRTEIAYHDELYFKKSAPVISDGAYDQLKRELAALEQAFPSAAKNGENPAAVGDDRVGSFATRRHRVRMLSLNKSYSETEVRAFDARLVRQLGRTELDYVVEPKFDGLAISVTFEKEN